MTGEFAKSIGCEQSPILSLKSFGSVVAFDIGSAMLDYLEREICRERSGSRKVSLSKLL